MNARTRNAGETAPLPGLEPEEVSGDLAGGIGARRTKRRILGDRQLPGRDLAVDISAADREHPFHSDFDRRLEHVQRAFGVDSKRLDRSPPRAADIGPARQVVDDLGPHPFEQAWTAPASVMSTPP